MWRAQFFCDAEAQWGRIFKSYTEKDTALNLVLQTAFLFFFKAVGMPTWNLLVKVMIQMAKMSTRSQMFIAL